MTAMNVVVCVKQIPDPADPGALDPETKTLDAERQAHPRRVRQLRRRDGPPAGRHGRRRRGHPRLDGAQQRGERPAHRAGHGRGQGRPGQRPGPGRHRRAGHGQGAGRRHQAGRGRRPGPHRHRVERRLHRHRARAARRAARTCPSVTFAKSIAIDGATVKVERQTEAGYDEVECPLPAVVSVTAGVVEPRYPSFKGIMAAKSKPVDEVTVADLGLDAGQVGWAGAGQEIVVHRRRRGPPGRRDHRGRRRRLPRRSSPSSTTSRSSEEPLTMTLSKIWVFAEATDGKVSSTTLELLTKARELADTVEAVYAGADADAVAGPLGAHGATTVHAAPATSATPCRASRWPPPSPPPSAAAAPDAILFATTYDGRDVVGRLSVKLDQPVLTNNVDLGARRRRARRHRADLRRQHQRGHQPSPAPARTWCSSGPKSFAAEESGGGAGRGRARWPCPTLGASGRCHHHRPPRRGARGPEARRGRHRRVRRPWPRRGREVPDDRGPGQAAEGRARRLAGHRRRRLGALLATRSARPARSSSPPSTSPPASPVPPSTWWA